MLWEHVEPAQNSSIYNGGVEAVSNLLGKKYLSKVTFAEYRLGTVFKKSRMNESMNL